MNRFSGDEQTPIAVEVVLDIVQIDIPPVAVPVEARKVELLGRAVLKEICKVSSITPPIECHLVPVILTKLNLI